MPVSSAFSERFSALRAAIAEVSRLVDSPADPVALTDRYREAIRIALEICVRSEGEVATDLTEEVSESLGALEEGARDFLRDTSMEPDRVVTGLALLKGYASLLRRITGRVEGAVSQAGTPSLMVELEEVENSLRTFDAGEEAASDPGREARERVRDLRLRVLLDQARRQLEAARCTLDSGAESMEACYRRFREMDRICQQLRFRVRDASAASISEVNLVLDQVSSFGDRLEATLFRALDGASTLADLKVVSGLAILLTSELDEARMTAYEVDTREELEELVRLHRLALRFSGAFRKLLGALRGSVVPETREAEESAEARRIWRRLVRMARRVRNLEGDRVLALRLDRLLGRRAVQAWEAIVFWLIMAVLGLIVVDHYSDSPPPGVVPWTTWADTGICAVLLLDFAIRWALAPRRLIYLRRRFLTELLPSIPFGLLASQEAAFRTIRILRLARVVRVLRVLRPLIRAARLALFVARAADRLVEKNAWLLNQNIVFFTDPVRDEQVPTLVKRARDLETWITRSARECLPGFPVGAKLAWAGWRATLLEADLELATVMQGPLLPGADRAVPDRVRDLDVEDVVRTLRDLNGPRIAETMGLEFARQVNASLRFFRLPLIRRLPVVRFVMGPEGSSDPLSTTARLGRVMGDLLAFAHRTVTWFADLYGSITGAQFLDRVGMQLVKATARPAWRLVLFGGIVGLALLLVRMTRLGFLEVAAEALLKFLSLPVLILGGLCLIPLALGLWFRRIAGQAADFYDRVAEAQFLPLTETIKESQCEQILGTLCDRVILPESRVRCGRGNADPEADARVRRQFVAQGLADPLLNRKAERAGEQLAVPRCWESTLLFYRSFLDGAYFHRNDTSVANMLLGNLTLENVRINRLGYGKREKKRLLRLDIGRGKGGVAGPYVWFNFITHAVAQHTARLIIEYNQHCVPLEDLEGADPRDLELFRKWLRKRADLSREREQGTVSRREEAITVSGTDGTLLYRTSEFNALHFLSRNSGRDELIRRRFGDEVMRLLEEDRQNLIRVIFGTYPMDELTKEKRTFNPYRSYRRYLSRGKVFLFPLVGTWFLFCSVRLLVSRLVVTVKDVLNPDTQPLRVFTGRAGFDVARRKIHRMRRPVVLEAVRLRAEFDVQYLGLALPGKEPVGWAGYQLAEDLLALNASELEWEEFRELKSLRQRQLRWFSKVLRRAGEHQRDLWSDLLARNSSLAGREREALRAMATAFVCDHEKVLRVVTAYEELCFLLYSSPAESPPKQRLARFTSRHIHRALAHLWTLPGLSAVSAEARQQFTKKVLRAGRAAREWLLDLEAHLPAGEEPYLFAYERLLEVGDQPGSWSEQMVAVRAVQSLGLIDLRGYEALIQELGQYPLEG
ncbi:MAG: hypothetical protein V2A76_19010 [Planctomycetota bacterium]